MERKTILNFLFTDEEIAEIKKLDDKAVSEFLADMELDLYATEDRSEVEDYVKSIFDGKDIPLNQCEVLSVMGLIYENIR